MSELIEVRSVLAAMDPLRCLFCKRPSRQGSTVCGTAACRSTKWNREHPERRREIANRYAKKPGVMTRHSAATTARRRLHLRLVRLDGGAVVYRCKECNAEWCPAPWARGLSGRGEFCTNACRMRYRYQERTPGARRITPRGMKRQQPNARQERLTELAQWLEARWYGATKAQLLERFDELYPDCRPRTASERRFYRDLGDVCATGRFVAVRGRFIRVDRAHALPDDES